MVEQIVFNRRMLVINFFVFLTIVINFKESGFGILLCPHYLARFNTLIHRLVSSDSTCVFFFVDEKLTCVWWQVIK